MMPISLTGWMGRALGGLASVALSLAPAAQAAPTYTFIDRATQAHRAATSLVQQATARGDPAAAERGRAAIRSIDGAVSVYLKACPLLPINGEPRPNCASREAAELLELVPVGEPKEGAR